MEEKTLSYFRLKSECIVEADNGALTKQKIEELVLASNYTEVETLAYQLIASQERNRFGSVNFEIIKTKITDVIYNDILSHEESPKGICCEYFTDDDTTGVGLYSVKVVFKVEDEKSGKIKKVTEMFYIPASSNADATSRIERHIGDTMSDYVIRETKFDNAEAIYWPLEAHNSKVNDYEQQ